MLVDLPGHELVHQVAAGPLHTVVLTRDGSFYSFGSCSEGRLPFGGASASGIGGWRPRDQGLPKKLELPFKGWVLEQKRATDTTAAVQAARLTGGHAGDPDWWPARLFSGGAASAALTSASVSEEVECIDEASIGGAANLWIWGSSEVAAAANGASEEGGVWRPSLMQRSFRRPVRSLAIGHRHCLAIVAEALYSWGDNCKGQLGNGTTTGSAIPQRLASPVDSIAVAAGEEHSLCIVHGGIAFSWGNAEGGRLGLGRCISEGIQRSPRKVASVDDAEGRGGSVAAQDAQGAGCPVWKVAAAGPEHSALIDEENRVWTFGMGWFGRLGHGSMDNKYSPALAQIPDVKVREVHCGMYHTCIVDRFSVLWACGRDTALCRRRDSSGCGGGHALSPVRFEPFWQVPEHERRKVLSVAVCDQHTLAITTCPGQADGTELWVWGENKKGQLGAPERQFPRVDLPWRLRLPAVESDGPSLRHKLVQVVTAPGHSMCLVHPLRSAAGSPAASNDGDSTPGSAQVLAWGSCAEGRLGFGPTSAKEGLALRGGGGGGNSSLPPDFVPAAWKPQAEVVREQLEFAGLLDTAVVREGASTASGSWLDFQIKLWSEPEECRRPYLLEEGKQVEALFAGFAMNAYPVGDEPTPSSLASDASEYYLRQGEREVERQFLRTLQALGLGPTTASDATGSAGGASSGASAGLGAFLDAPGGAGGAGGEGGVRGACAPAVVGGGCGGCGVLRRGERLGRVKDGGPRTDPEIRGQLHLFEELIWTLQQQPLYLANLASRLRGRAASDPEAETFDRVCARLFADLKETRTRNLFGALLRLLVKGEIKAAISAERMFDLETSRVAPLVSHFVTSPFAMRSIALPLLDPENEQSLVSAIIQYTLRGASGAAGGACSGAGRAGRGGGLRAPQNGSSVFLEDGPELSGVLALNRHEYEELMRQHHAEQTAGREAEIPDYLRSQVGGYYEAECLAFAGLLVGSEVSHEGGENTKLEDSTATHGAVLRFIRYYILDVLGGDKNDKSSATRAFRMVLASAFDDLMQARQASQDSSSPDTAAAPLTPEICMPLVSLVLGAALAELLLALVSSSSFALLRHQVQRRVQAEASSGDAEHRLLRRVLWNIQVVARFFQCMSCQAAATASPGVDQTIALCQGRVKAVACQALFDILRNSKCSEDILQDRLRADLHRARFPLADLFDDEDGGGSGLPSLVRLSTVDLLEMTNLLWKHMEPAARKADRTPTAKTPRALPGVRIRASERDRLHQLLREILPRRVERGLATDQVVLWSAEVDIWEASQHGESHNFRLRQRLGEASQGGLYDDAQELVLCSVSGVPVPKYLAAEAVGESISGGCGGEEDAEVQEGEQLCRRPQVEQLRAVEAAAASALSGATPGGLQEGAAGAYSAVEEALEALAGRRDENNASSVKYQISGRTLQELENELSCVHSRLYADVEDGRAGAAAEALLRQLGEAWRAVQRLIASGEDEAPLLAYLDAGFRRREEYREYLRRMQELAKLVLSARRSHNESSQESTDLLSLVAKVTSACDLPEAYHAAARRGKKPVLAFVRARKAKLARRQEREWLTTFGRSRTKKTIFRLAMLIANGVIVRLKEHLQSKAAQDRMSVSIDPQDDVVEVKVLSKGDVVGQFVVTSEELKLAEGTNKNAILPYADGLLWISCFRFRCFLAILDAEQP